jgi:hypothetical protein
MNVHIFDILADVSEKHHDFLLTPAEATLAYRTRKHSQAQSL